jgi:hypothetical protein
MAKRVDHDSTMEVSSSQLVPGEVKRPAPHQAPGVSKNDVSMWIGGVVGADAFAGTPKKPATRRGLRVVLLVLLVAAIAGAAGYYFFGRGEDPKPSAAPSTPLDAAAVLPMDAGAVATPVDAATDASVSDAAAGDAGVLQVDAISGLPAKPPAKKPVTTKKKTTKKPVPKKKR